MNSRATPSFWRLYSELPAEVQTAAKRAFRRFQDDPRHPSLHLKKLQGFDNVWSARVTRSYRAVGIREQRFWTWFWIGSHADFDAQFS